jgi:hypothetical protein
MAKLVIARGLIGGLAFLESATTAFLRSGRAEETTPLLSSDREASFHCSPCFTIVRRRSVNSHTLSAVGLDRIYWSREMTFGLILAQGARWSASWLLPCTRCVPHSCGAAVNKPLESSTGVVS